MRKLRRKQNIEENVNYFCKKNNLQLTQQQENQVKDCFLLYENTFSSKSKLCQYLKHFIKYDLKFWKQRLKKLTQIKLKGVTKKKFLLLYGKKETLERWRSYIEKQSTTNSYEYKEQKYGWSKQDFLNYNKSRSITIENMVKKYGEVIGLEKYNEYISKQKYSGCSLEYFIEKYGKIKGIEFYNNLCKQKAQNLLNYINRYGEIDGRKKYRNYIESRSNYYSKSSQELFWKIKTNNCHFAEYNKEFGLLSEKKYYFYDYVDTKLKKCIEYNGDYWHCNPEIYSSDYKTHYGYTASEIWNNDEEKLNFIKSKGYDVMIVWESDYIKDMNNIRKKVEDFLYDKN